MTAPFVQLNTHSVQTQDSGRNAADPQRTLGKKPMDSRRCIVSGFDGASSGFKAEVSRISVSMKGDTFGMVPPSQCRADFEKGRRLLASQSCAFSHPKNPCSHHSAVCVLGATLPNSSSHHSAAGAMGRCWKPQGVWKGSWVCR